MTAQTVLYLQILGTLLMGVGALYELRSKPGSWLAKGVAGVGLVACLWVSL